MRLSVEALQGVSVIRIVINLKRNFDLIIIISTNRGLTNVDEI